MRNASKILVGKSHGTGHIGIDVRTILKWILEK